jgi:hypothetical protein
MAGFERTALATRHDRLRVYRETGAYLAARACGTRTLCAAMEAQSSAATTA